MPQASAMPAALCSEPPEAMKREQHGDQHDIQQPRGEGGDGEAAIGVEHAGIERDQRHEEKIGKRDARQQHGERELLGIAAKPGASNSISQGMAISPRMVKATSRTMRPASAWSAKARAAASPVGMQSAWRKEG